MANNRMYIVNERTGQRAMIAKHLGESWVFVDESAIDAIETMFDTEGFGSKDWCIRYEHGEPNIDAILPPEE